MATFCSPTAQHQLLMAVPSSKDVVLPPSRVLISAVVDLTLVAVQTAAALTAAVARTCGPVPNVAAARNAAQVLTLVAVHTYALVDHNEGVQFVRKVAASQSSADASPRCRFLV